MKELAGKPNVIMHGLMVPGRPFLWWCILLPHQLAVQKLFSSYESSRQLVETQEKSYKTSLFASWLHHHRKKMGGNKFLMKGFFIWHLRCIFWATFSTLDPGNIQLHGNKSGFYPPVCKVLGPALISALLHKPEKLSRLKRNEIEGHSHLKPLWCSNVYELLKTCSCISVSEVTLSTVSWLPRKISFLPTENPKLCVEAASQHHLKQKNLLAISSHHASADIHIQSFPQLQTSILSVEVKHSFDGIREGKELNRFLSLLFQACWSSKLWEQWWLPGK